MQGEDLLGESEGLTGLSSWEWGSVSVKVPGASSGTFMGRDGNFVPGGASCTGADRCWRQWLSRTRGIQARADPSGKWWGRLQHLAGGWTVHSRQKRDYLGQCPAHPCQRGPSLTGLWSEPGGAELTTPTEVKAATELMMVGMMLNLPACMNKDRGEWAGGLAGGPAGRE